MENFEFSMPSFDPDSLLAEEHLLNEPNSLQDERNNRTIQNSSVGTKKHRKPDASTSAYSRGIFECLLSSPTKSMALTDIYEWWWRNTETGRAAHTEQAQTRCKNSIRHNLSLNQGFVGSTRITGEKHPAIWSLAPEVIERGYIEPTTRFRDSIAPSNGGGGSRVKATARVQKAPVRRHATRTLPTRRARLQQQAAAQRSPVPQTAAAAAEQFPVPPTTETISNGSYMTGWSDQINFQNPPPFANPTEPLSSSFSPLLSFQQHLQPLIELPVLDPNMYSQWTPINGTGFDTPYNPSHVYSNLMSEQLFPHSNQHLSALPPSQDTWGVNPFESFLGNDDDDYTVNYLLESPFDFNRATSFDPNFDEADFLIGS